MRLVVGSTRAPKVAAVRTALARLAALPWPGEETELVPLDVPSGQADTPLSDSATLAGARHRARRALAELPEAHLALGLEGGIAVITGVDGQVFLRNWVVAWDGRREGIGSGPSVLLPDALSRPVLGGEDLAAAIDRYASQEDVRSRQGTFGILTHDMITRTDSFALAVLAALAPWYSPNQEA